jgi:hypothetical protein
LFSIILVINLTPASALDMAGIQNNVNNLDNYAHSSFWYKFWHFFDFTNTMASLLSQIQDTANELPSHLQRGMEILPKALEDRRELDDRNKKLNLLSKYYSNDTIKSNWANDPDETSDVENNVTNNKTSKNSNLTENINANKKMVQAANIDSNSSNLSGNKSSNKDKLSSTKVVDEANIVNKTKNTTKKNNPNPPKDVVDDAEYIKNQLKDEGIDVKVVHHTIENLKKDDLVQLVDIQGFIKYMVYEGNTTQDGNPAVMLYNGQYYQIITQHKFVAAYTGQVLELTDNNDTNITTTDIADKIYATHLNILTHKIGVFGDWITIGNTLEWIGGSISTITTLIGFIVIVIAACISKTAGTALAVIAAIVSAVIIVIGLAILATGLIIVDVLQKNSDDTKTEKDDLTTQCI